MKGPLVFSVLAWLASGVASASPYRVTDLGTLGGSYSVAYGLNAGGQVVGAAYTQGDATYHAFLYSGGGLQDLGTLSGGTYSTAFGINDGGVVVGLAQTAGEPRAFIYQGGSLQSLGFSSESYAWAINHNGLVVGSYFLPGNLGRHAFSWQAGTVHDLGALNGGIYSEALALNNAGRIVGYDFDPVSGVHEAVTWPPGGAIQLLGESGKATGVNQNGQICGYGLTAWLYTGGSVQSLGSLGGGVSQAMGINTVGRVVGSSLLATGETHGFIYQSGSLVDLNSLLLPGSGWSVVEANAINDVGQIAGLGINGAGERHALLLTPTPEPCTLSFLIFALLFKRRP